MKYNKVLNLENKEKRLSRRLFDDNGPMYFGTCGLPGQRVTLIRRTLDQWAREKDSIVGNGRGRVGEAVGGLVIPTYQSCLINIILMMELVLRLYMIAPPLIQI